MCDTMKWLKQHVPQRTSKCSKYNTITINACARLQNRNSSQQQQNKLYSNKNNVVCFPQMMMELLSS